MARPTVAVVAMVALAGCSEGAGDFGATPGGAQDFALARAQIAEGVLPRPEAFAVEGLFSEHDLPVPSAFGERCDDPLCVHGALAVAPDALGEPQGWLQIGLTSGVDPDPALRPSQTLVLLVDVSGSMEWSHLDGTDDNASPGQIARRLLSGIASRLGSDDRVAIVTFGTRVSTALDFVPGDDPAVFATIDRLREDGSTNMEAGLQDAYAALSAVDFGTDEERVLLFTDVQPNVGARGSREFESIANRGAKDGIGLTAFALGTDIDPAVLTGMSHLRGGNAFAVTRAADVEPLLADSWPGMVSPLAYDLRLDVTPAPGFDVAATYGIPKSANGQARMKVSTVFPSHRRGAMLFELEHGFHTTAEDVGATVEISYQTRDASVTQTIDVLPVSHEAGADHGVRRVRALALLADGMAEAAREARVDAASAAAAYAEVDARFRDEALALGDADLADEVDLSCAYLQVLRNVSATGLSAR